jgi:hypothetical protein
VVSGGNSVQLLLMDEESLDNGLTVINTISNNSPFCGNHNPAKCVNDDIANIGVRTLLFTRGTNILPYSSLQLPTGQTGDEGLFRFTRQDPQVSLQNGAQFTVQQFIDAAGSAANENNLDKIRDVVPLNNTDIQALEGKTVCAVVFDSDISVDTSAHYGVLKGATMGKTAFTVVSTQASSGSNLRKITINLMDDDLVEGTCDLAKPGTPTSSTITAYLKK